MTVETPAGEIDPIRPRQPAPETAVRATGPKVPGGYGGPERRRSRGRRQSDYLADGADGLAGHRGQQLRHDIQHEVATLTLLATAVERAADVGEASRGQLHQLLGELRWLGTLVRSGLGKAEAEGSAPSPARVDLLVEEAIATLRLTTTARFDCDMTEAWAEADTLQLWRAIRNVIDNATRAAGGEGQVRVRVATREECTVVEVDDDGPGFGSGPGGNSSLGLGIVRAAVDQCRGDLTIERSALGGCAVRIWLPAPPFAHAPRIRPAELELGSPNGHRATDDVLRRTSVPDAEVDGAYAASALDALEDAPSEAGRPSQSRVLVCDDHRVFAESLAMVLTGRGYRVEAVTHSTAEAGAVLSRTPVDVCLLDLRFAAEPVLHQVPELRRAAPGVRFVLLSAHLDRRVVDEAVAAGIDVCLHKEQPVDDITEALERACAGKPHKGWTPSTAPRSRQDDARRLAAYLTPREREVLARLVRGESTTMLARAMGISRNTARSHVQRVLVKLGVHSRLEAAALAVRHGLVPAGNGG